jgi:hypothetical protein
MKRSVPSEISEFYSQLEQLTTINKWDLITEIIGLSEIYSGLWKENLLIERTVLSFTLKDGQLNQNFTGINKKGKEIYFPTITGCTKNAVRYLIERAQLTQNSNLIARYNHLLFEVEKNQKYAIRAITAYKQLINQKTNNKSKENIIEPIQAVLRLTEKIKFETKQLKTDLLNLVFNENLSVYDRYFVVRDLIKSKIYKSSDFSFLPELTLKWIAQTKDTDYFFIKYFLETAINVCMTNKLDTSIYYEKLAENEDTILKEHTEEKDFLRPKIYYNQMLYYKKAKNTEKYEEARKNYSAAKSVVELGLIPTSLSDEDINMIKCELDENVKLIMKWNYNKILEYFANDSELFPDVPKISKSIKVEFDGSFFRSITAVKFDTNSNIKNLSEHEEFNTEVYKSFLMHFNLSVIPVFKEVIMHGVINGKLSYPHVYKYLDNFTWFGQEFPKNKMRIKQVSESSYKWINMLAPGLHNFLSQIEASVLTKSNNRYSNWVLSTDSLTLKFEGAIRNFLFLSGESTSILKNNEAQEMNLEDLLYSDSIKRFFSENDLALFKLVFTSKGANIRNNVAHCFYYSDDYSFDKICKVFFCILRLSKYRFKQSNPSNE